MSTNYSTLFHGTCDNVYDILYHVDPSTIDTADLLAVLNNILLKMSYMQTRIQDMQTRIQELEQRILKDE